MKHNFILVFSSATWLCHHGITNMHRFITAPFFLGTGEKKTDCHSSENLGLRENLKSVNIEHVKYEDNVPMMPQ